MAIIRCKCVNEFQDKRYGAGMRVANPTAKGDKDWHDERCTVCGTVSRVPGASPVKTDKKAK